MRSVVLSLAATLAFASAAFAEGPEVLRGSSSTAQKTATTTAPAKPAVQKTASAVKQPVTPQTLRGSRYGGFAPAPAGSR